METVEYECEGTHTCNHKGGLSSEGGLLCDARTPEQCPYARKIVAKVVDSKQADCSRKY